MRSKKPTSRSKLRRVLHTIGVPLPWIRNLAIRFLGTPFFFLRFSVGNVTGIDASPAGAKYALTRKLGRSVTAISVSPLPSPTDVWEACQQAHRLTGVWPISFSYPLEKQERQRQAIGVVSPVFPGHRYGFTDEQEYLEMYGAYSFALTHKKDGWDCLRHLEIIYSGSVPFMPDAHRIPPFTMVHYPKQLFQEAASHLRHSGGYVSEDVSRALGTYFNRHLTSKAMANYLLRAAQVEPTDKVLFVDEVLPSMPDYQSVFTLIGLKQALKGRLSVAFPVDYIYDDWQGNALSLYGRGFGYSRSLSAKLRSPGESLGETVPLSKESLLSFDRVVIGSVTRNSEAVAATLAHFPASRTVWIHGEDNGPSTKDMELYKKLGVRAFARELKLNFQM